MSSSDTKRNDGLLGRMLVAFQVFQKRLADRTGLNTTDLLLLSALVNGGRAMTAGELAQTADLTSGAATTAIDRLEKAGVVQRQRSAEDRRAVMVVVRQPNAQKLLQQIEPIAEARRQLWSEFNERERDAISRFLIRSTEFANSWNFPEQEG